MTLQTSTLAERVSDFFKDSFDYMKYAAASAAGAVVIALSSGAAAQAPPTSASSAPAAASAPQAAPAPAPRRHLAPELQTRVDAFKEICNNPTYMGWLTRYAVSCAGVDEEYVRLRLETPVGHPDRQEQRQWELYKFGDVIDNFDFLINPETKNIMAQGVANLHNNAVRARNPNAPASDLLDPALIDIVSAGANGGGGSRFEVIYDINQHKEIYRTVGAPVKSRVKQRYGHSTPVWDHQETLVLKVELLQYVDVQGIRARIDREQQIQASSRDMYGTSGTIVFEKVDPANGNVLGVVEAKDQVFELSPGVYVPRGKDARNFTPFVDVNGDGQNDFGNAFNFPAGWQGAIRVRNQYTGAERISPEVRRSLENEVSYGVNVVAAPPAEPPAPQPPVPPPPAAPPAEPPAPVPPAAPPTPSTLLQQIDAEAAGMFARLSRHLNIVLMPGYGVFSLENTFEESGYEARSNAQGPTIAGRVSGLGLFGIPVRLALEGDYFRIKDGNGTVEKRGTDLGAFTYDGSWRTVAAEVAYARWLDDHVNEQEQYARRRDIYFGLRGEQAAAEISGRNITENERTTNTLLLVAGLDHASAALDSADHAVNVQLGAGVNKQSNTEGLDYDAGFSARITADYLARFGEMAITAGASGSYDNMSTGRRGQKQERDEISLAARLGGNYVFGDQRQHQVGLGIAHRTTLEENTAAHQTQVSETLQDTRVQITGNFAF